MYVIRNRTLRGLAIALSTLRLGSGIQAIVMPVIVLNVLHAGPVAVGVAWGISAVGGFVAALIFGRIDAAGRERLILATCYAGTGLGIGLLLFASNLVVVFAAMALTGFLNGPGDVTMFQRLEPLGERAFALHDQPDAPARGCAMAEHPPSGPDALGDTSPLVPPIGMWAMTAPTLS